MEKEMSFLPNYDIEERRREKMKSDHRILNLRPVAGRVHKDAIGKLDNRLFNGENKLHAQLNHTSGMWRLNYDSGALPGGLQMMFTTFPELLDHVRVYFSKRNVEVTDIVDAA